MACLRAAKLSNRYLALLATWLVACAKITTTSDGTGPEIPGSDAAGHGGARADTPRIAPITPPVQPITACFARGTPIATPTGEVPIEQIHVGDSVQAYDFARHSVVTSRVTGTMAHGLRSVLRLASSANVVLRVTPEHPIYVVDTGRFQPVAEIADGVSSLALTSLTSVAAMPLAVVRASEDEVAAVYDLTVEGLHNYFAAGLLVHNKSACWVDPSGCRVCADTSSRGCPSPPLPMSTPMLAPMTNPVPTQTLPVDAGQRLDAASDAAQDARVAAAEPDAHDD
jgi:hypothetical protein